MAQELEEKDLEVSLPRYYWEKLKSIDKSAKSLLLVTGLFVIFAISTGTVILSLRNYAANEASQAELLLDSVQINPGLVTTAINIKSTPLSALAYDKLMNPIFSGVTYEWGMSSASSPASLSVTDQNTTDLVPLHEGFAEVHVIARAGSKYVTKTVPVTITDATGNPPVVDTVPKNLLATWKCGPDKVADIDFSWDLNDGVNHYNLDFRNTASSNIWTLRDIINPQAGAGGKVHYGESFLLASGSADMEWRVYAGYNDGQGFQTFGKPFTIVCSLATPTPVSLVPGNFTLKISSTKKHTKNRIGVNLVWTKSTNAVKYNVYQRISKTANWEAALISTAALKYEALVDKTKPHYFVVEACNTISCVKSNEVFVNKQ